MKNRLSVAAFFLLVLSLLGSACTTVKQQQPKTGSDVQAAVAEPCVPPDVTVPQTNAEIRLWYNYQVVAIGKINERWAATGVGVEDRARRAYEMRHNARVDARFMMQNKDEVKMLQERDQAKYGNPDGPTFAYLVDKNREKGLEGDAIYEAIIESSSRTSSAYNKKYDVKRN